MVEVGYGRGRVESELSQLGSRWFVHACVFVISTIDSFSCLLLYR